MDPSRPPKPPQFRNSNQQPPPNYVPGVGRGATGFTTRSDIGPAVPPPCIGTKRKTDSDDDEQQEEYINDEGLLSSSVYDDDDVEADAIYKRIDEIMASRRRTKQVIHNNPIINASNPSDYFNDLKGALHTVSDQQWESLTDPANLSRKKKQKRFQSFDPAPDTLYEKACKEKQHVTSVLGTETDLTAVGEGRGMILALKLDRVSDSVVGKTVVDPKGYLTDLKCVSNLTGNADVKKCRLLLKSVTQTNPKNPMGWIAAARVEEEIGNVEEARRFIRRGCEECPRSEDVWLTACHLASPGEAKGVIARGVKLNPGSVNLWVQAADLENDKENRSRVLRKALDRIPDSVRLWKLVVDIANEADARILLQRAVEYCPLHVELWLALARLETYENAKKVLIEARKRLPKEHAIWIAAAMLEEANGKTDRVGKLIEKGIRTLQIETVDINRDVWIKEAEGAERAGSLATCQAIIHSTIGIGVDDIDRKMTWVGDAKECKSRGSIETARAIYAHALTFFVTEIIIWRKAAKLEKKHGTRESLDALLRQAVTYMPQAEVLWLMAAKEKWINRDVPAARAILQEAYAAIPNSEEIWLAAFKLEFENHEPDRARMLLAKARERGGTERVWMKSVIVEREQGNAIEARRLLEEARRRFPSFFKLWLMLGQLEDEAGNAEKAKEAYQSGLQHCPACVPLWISLASLTEKTDGLNKARVVLINAKVKNPKNAELWLAEVRAELKHGNKKDADLLITKALQECPTSGILWAACIEMAPLSQRKSKCRDVYRKLNNDPHVIAAVAKLYWQHRKLKYARELLNKAVSLGPDIGDNWALLYKFELQHGDEQKQEDVIDRCTAAGPKHGERWQAISKAVENSHQTVEAVLKKTVVALEKEDNVF